MQIFKMAGNFQSSLEMIILDAYLAILQSSHVSAKKKKNLWNQFFMDFLSLWLLG